MSDKLKAHISSQLDEETAQLNDGHFDRFKAKQQKLTASNISKKEKTSHLPQILKIAASVIILFGLGWFVFNQGKIQGAQEIGEASSTTKQQDFNQELAQAEMFFSAKVNAKKKELISYSSEENEATKSILNELRKLELQYEDLKAELAINANNAYVINAMVENYRMRLNVLEQLLDQLKKSEQLKQKHHVEIQA